MPDSGHIQSSRGSRVVLLLVAMLLIAGVIYFFWPFQPALISLYFLSTLLAACWFGRKGGLLAALGSLALIVALMLLQRVGPASTAGGEPGASEHRGIALVIWGACLLVTGYVMGVLFEREQAESRELHETYWAFLPLLSMFVNKDDYSQQHVLRVSVCAAKIAAAMGLPQERIEDVRAAALVRDLGMLKTSRETLTKAAALASETGEPAPSPRVGGSLRRILPIILAEAVKSEAASEAPRERPLETRILAVADVYASLTTDRPYRKAMSAGDAKDVIVRGAGTEFDQEVVRAFERAFANRELEVIEGMA